MRIILCGFGVVAQSLVKLFESRFEDLYGKYGFKPRVVGVFDSKGSAVDQSGLQLDRLSQIKKEFGTVKNYSDTGNSMSGVEMLNEVNADVLIETTASNYKDAEPGMTHITTAMKKGLHVVSVNKGPLALAFPSLMELAVYNQVLFKFSGNRGRGNANSKLCKEQPEGRENNIIFRHTERNHKLYPLKDGNGAVFWKSARGCKEQGVCRGRRIPGLGRFGCGCKTCNSCKLDNGNEGDDA